MGRVSPVPNHTFHTYRFLYTEGFLRAAFQFLHTFHGFHPYAQGSASLCNAMKLGCNHPMGPIELTDFVGIDTMLATMTGLYNGFHDSKYRPCPLLETMVKSGMLGKKTGQGFYKYDEKGNKIGSNF